MSDWSPENCLLAFGLSVFQRLVLFQDPLADPRGVSLESQLWQAAEKLKVADWRSFGQEKPFELFELGQPQRLNPGEEILNGVALHSE